MIVGNPSIVAIESRITLAYSSLSQRALGFFNIHISGQRYGIKRSDATLLACSFDAVRQRISRRGDHISPLASEDNARKLSDVVCMAIYSDECEEQFFKGMSCNYIRQHIHAHELIWAPDGDSAFDDGSHVLQFDANDKVRLIAFKTTGIVSSPTTAVKEAWMNAEEYYAMLDTWQQRFEAEWLSTPKHSGGTEPLH
jgi:hypothetical protein